MIEKKIVYKLSCELENVRKIEWEKQKIEKMLDDNFTYKFKL